MKLELGDVVRHRRLGALLGRVVALDECDPLGELCCVQVFGNLWHWKRSELEVVSPLSWEHPDFFKPRRRP